MTRKGFTIIELLVVVSILALTASLILVGIQKARERAISGAIQANLVQVRKEAEAIFLQTNSYIAPGNTLCDSSNTLNDTNLNYPGLKAVENEILKRNNNQPVTCYANAADYCVETALVPSDYFCVDGRGLAKKISSPVCTSTNIKCD